jgi:cobalt-zinc-cadmium efflux system outer membrane protein
MPAIRTIALVFVTAGAVGCATVRPDVKINEAGDLVEQRLGQRPAWMVPWDDSPPDLAAGGVLRLDQAVALALRNNRMLRAELETIGQADADLVQAGLLQNPVINFMVMFPDGGGRTMLRASGLPMQPLQDLWLLPARRNVARAELQQAVLRVADRAIATAAAVKTTYARLQYTRRALELLQENLQLAEQSTRIIQTRQIAGQVTQVALNLAHIRSQRLRSELLALEAEHRSLQREVLLQIGFPGASDEWTVEPVHELEDALAAPAAEAELLEIGAAQRLDLKAAEWSLEAAERRIALMRREGWPDLALGFTFERAPAPSTPRGPTVPARVGNAAAQAATDSIFGQPPMLKPPMVTPFSPKLREVKWTLGPMLELELPVFDQNQIQVAKALHEYNQKLAEYEARAQEVTREIRDAHVKRQQAYEQVRFYREAIVPEVVRNLDLAQQSFVAGEESLTVYLQAQEDLLTTRQKMLEFLRAYLVSGVELERAVGGSLAVPGPTSQPASAPAAAATETPSRVE